MNKNLEKAVRIIKRGGIVIFPTDTAFGIGCRIDDDMAVKKIFAIKKRSTDNALLVLVDSTEMAEKYVEIPGDVREKLINKYWPGGLTIFLPCKQNMVPPLVRANSKVLAVRWPNHKEIEEVIKAVGVPIIATSANISGEPTPYSLDEVDKILCNHVDYIMKGDCTYKKESTIIDTTVSPWEIIREGAVKLNL